MRCVGALPVLAKVNGLCDGMQMRTVEALYEKPTGIECRFDFPEVNGKILREVLIVSFSGAYPPGSRGNRHGEYIAVMAMYGLLAFNRRSSRRVPVRRH